jgi:hypothetical protein
MDEQPFAYYQHTQGFNSYPVTQYPPGSYDPDYVANDGTPFVDGYGGAQVQGGAQGWSPAFPTPNASASFQRRGGVSAAASGNPRPEGDGEVQSGQLRLDVNGGEPHQEVRRFPYTLLIRRAPCSWRAYLVKVAKLGGLVGGGGFLVDACLLVS